MGPEPVNPEHSSMPIMVGWKEYMDFPDWGIRRVKVKMDTGARTSALDVLSYDLHPATDESGPIADLVMALSRRHRKRLTRLRVPLLGMAVVCNSAGMREERPIIETSIRLGPITKRVRLTITNRSHMLFRVILGRTALAGDFIVDVSRKYLLGKRRQ
jgi:hypothetical protein